ncbi:MAG TPA: zf-HC2 domain-containing protein [Bryobacteraceae bacterium]|nr:zf-HC2 domain-containing protein [Bryobacteraceae bacterium]
MSFQESHLTDQQLLQELDGEISEREKKQVQGHLNACWQCRTRQKDIEASISSFVESREQEFASALPPIAGPRALLKARIAQMRTESDKRSHRLSLFRRTIGAAAAVFIALAIGVLFISYARQQNILRQRAPVVSLPNSTITPGATVMMTQQQVCMQTNTKNKAVPFALQRRVFDEYGIKSATPQLYEVDYLVTPALGGADDIRNLWPQSYSAVWNAQVKDELEDRLRQLVCGGSLTLAEAQRDIAGDWIGAYKKYFRTDKPRPVSMAR